MRLSMDLVTFHCFILTESLLISCCPYRTSTLYTPCNQTDVQGHVCTAGQGIGHWQDQPPPPPPPPFSIVIVSTKFEECMYLSFFFQFPPSSHQCHCFNYRRRVPISCVCVFFFLSLYSPVPAVFCKNKSQILQAEKANFAKILQCFYTA